jgi:hypothetical protein
MSNIADRQTIPEADKQKLQQKQQIAQSFQQEHVKAELQLYG